MSPSSQLFALNGMAGGGLWPAGEAAPVSKAKEPGLWAAGPGREPGWRSDRGRRDLGCPAGEGRSAQLPGAFRELGLARPQNLCDLLGYTCTLNPSNKGEKEAAGSSVMLFIFSLCKCLLNISEIFKRFYWLLLVYCMWFFSSLFSLKCPRAGKWE